MHIPISLATPVGEILQHWHFTAALFFEYHMRCPICDLSNFETLEDALWIYNIEPESFLRAINQMIAENPTTINQHLLSNTSTNQQGAVPQHEP